MAPMYVAPSTKNVEAGSAVDELNIETFLVMQVIPARAGYSHKGNSRRQNGSRRNLFRRPGRLVRSASRPPKRLGAFNLRVLKQAGDRFHPRSVRE